MSQQNIWHLLPVTRRIRNILQYFTAKNLNITFTGSDFNAVPSRCKRQRKWQIGKKRDKWRWGGRIPSSHCVSPLVADGIYFSLGLSVLVWGPCLPLMECDNKERHEDNYCHSRQSSQLSWSGQILMSSVTSFYRHGIQKLSLENCLILTT